MNTTIVALQLPHDDAMQLYRAALAQFYREQARRDRLGLERLVYLQSLMAFEKTLGLTPERVHVIAHEIEHELVDPVHHDDAGGKHTGANMLGDACGNLRMLQFLGLERVGGIPAAGRLFVAHVVVKRRGMASKRTAVRPCH